VNRRRAALLFTLAALSGGCERGCLSRWLSDKGGAASGESGEGRGVTLSAVDCPDGIARCGAGTVSISRPYHYAVPCTGSPEQCACPWERLGDCPEACVAEGVEIDLPKDLAIAQLCAPRPNVTAFVGPPHGDELVTQCDEGYLCKASLVIACGVASRAIGLCAFGCVRDGQSIDPEDGQELTAAGASAILCLRK
jgi:hypothetical protein